MHVTNVEGMCLCERHELKFLGTYSFEDVRQEMLWEGPTEVLRKDHVHRIQAAQMECYSTNGAFHGPVGVAPLSELPCVYQEVVVSLVLRSNVSRASSESQGS